MLEAQLAGIEALEVGKAGWEVDLAAREVIEQAGYGKYFGHGLGHSLGLNIHENPRASRTYMGAFKTGNVITIEPGIYIPGKGGVRIEDLSGARGQAQPDGLPQRTGDFVKAG